MGAVGNDYGEQRVAVEPNRPCEPTSAPLGAARQDAATTRKSSARAKGIFVHRTWGLAMPREEDEEDESVEEGEEDDEEQESEEEESEQDAGESEEEEDESGNESESESAEEEPAKGVRSRRQPWNASRKPPAEQSESSESSITSSDSEAGSDSDEDEDPVLNEQARRYAEFLSLYGPNGSKRSLKDMMVNDRDWETYIMTGHKHRGPSNLLKELQQAEVLGHKIPMQWRQAYQQLRKMRRDASVAAKDARTTSSAARALKRHFMQRVANGEPYDKCLAEYRKQMKKRHLPYTPPPLPKFDLDENEHSWQMAGEIANTVVENWKEQGWFEIVPRTLDWILDTMTHFNGAAERKEMEVLIREQERFERMVDYSTKGHKYEIAFYKEFFAWVWDSTSLWDKMFNSLMLSQIAMVASCYFSYHLLLNSSYPSPFKPMAGLAFTAVGATAVLGMASTIEEDWIRPWQFPWKKQTDPLTIYPAHLWIMQRVWLFFVPLVSPGFGWEPWSKMRNYYLFCWVAAALNQWGGYFMNSFAFYRYYMQLRIPHFQWPGSHYDFPASLIDYPVPNFALLCIMASGLNAILRYPLVFKLPGLATIVGGVTFMYGSHLLMWMTNSRTRAPMEGTKDLPPIMDPNKVVLQNLQSVDIRPWGHWTVALAMPILALGLPAITMIDFADPTLSRLNPLDIIRKVVLNSHRGLFYAVSILFSQHDFRTVPDAYATFRNAWTGIGPIDPNALQYQTVTPMDDYFEGGGLPYTEVADELWQELYGEQPMFTVPAEEEALSFMLGDEPYPGDEEHAMMKLSFDWDKVFEGVTDEELRMERNESAFYNEDEPDDADDDGDGDDFDVQQENGNESDP